MTEYFDIAKEDLPEAPTEVIRTQTLNQFLNGASPFVYAGYLNASDPDRWMRNYLKYCRAHKQCPMPFLVALHEGVKSDLY